MMALSPQNVGSCDFRSAGHGYHPVRVSVRTYPYWVAPGRMVRGRTPLPPPPYTCTRYPPVEVPVGWDFREHPRAPTYARRKKSFACGLSSIRDQAIHVHIHIHSEHVYNFILPPSTFVSHILRQRKGALLASQRPNSSSLYLKSISDLKSLLV